jgi:hypothetical protein
MQVGDLIKYSGRIGLHVGRLGVVVDFDHEAEGVLCFIEGQNLWFSNNQVEVVNESR